MRSCLSVGRVALTVAAALTPAACGSGSQLSAVAHEATPLVLESQVSAATAQVQAGAFVLSTGPKLCLAAKAGARANGTRIELQPCRLDDVAQRWQRVGQSLRLFGGQCLDAVGGRDREGTALQLWACDDDNANQRWEWAGDQLQWSEHARCVGAFDAGLVAGEPAQLWRCRYALAGQRFALVAAPSAAAAPAVPTPKPASAGTSPSASVSPTDIACESLGTWPASSARYEQEVLALVNERRAKGASCGSKGTFSAQPPLRAHQGLTCLARAFAKDLRENRYFSHTDRSGHSPFERMQAARIAFSSAAENIAEGQASPQEVVEGWMHSDGHCANIMGPYASLGVGFVDNVWVQDFATMR